MVRGAAMETNQVTVRFGDGLVVLKLGRDEPSYSMDPSGKLVYSRGSEVLTSTLQTAAEVLPPKAHAFRYHRVSLGQQRYTPMPSYIPLMGTSSLSSEMENISSILLARGGTRRLDQGTVSPEPVQEGKLKSKVYRNFREKKDGAPKGVGAFSIEEVDGGPLLGARGGGFVVFWD